MQFFCKQKICPGRRSVRRLLEHIFYICIYCYFVSVPLLFDDVGRINTSWHKLSLNAHKTIKTSNTSLQLSLPYYKIDIKSILFLSDRFFLFGLELLYVHQIAARDNKPAPISCRNRLFLWHQKSRTRPTRSRYLIFGNNAGRNRTAHKTPVHHDIHLLTLKYF